MCNLAISSKAVHAHMELCEEQLTALRKEKIDVNRQKKALLVPLFHISLVDGTDRNEF
jgi:bromodomain adjacent to zinc finger domain protein 1A